MRKILLPLVGDAVRARGDSAVAGCDLHVKAGVMNAVPHLVEGAHARKNRVGRGIGDESGSGHPRRRGHHVLLGYAEIERPLREPGCEFVRAHRLGNVRIQHNDIGVSFSQLKDGFRVSIAGRLLPGPGE
jgi:hypothetical protein